MPSRTLDEAAIRAERKVRKRFALMLLKYYGDRLPTIEEASQMFNVSPELIQEGMIQLFGEEMMEGNANGNSDR